MGKAKTATRIIATAAKLPNIDLKRILILNGGLFVFIFMLMSGGQKDEKR